MKSHSVGYVVLGVAAFSITVRTHAQTILYVDQNAPGPVHDGWTWCTAFTDLQDALDVAVFDVVIRVADGVYKPDRGTLNRSMRFDVRSSIALEGGFAGCGATDPNLNHRDTYAVFLSGDLAGNDSGDLNDASRNENSFRVVQLSSAELRGFYVIGGRANSSGMTAAGIYAENSRINNCFIVENSSDSDGGAVYLEGACEMSHCELLLNSAGGDGGGAYARPFAQGLLVSNCVFDNNSARNGGALAISIQHLTGAHVDQCIFRHNNTDGGNGGALYYNPSSAQVSLLSNSLFVLNTTGGSGGAVFSTSSLHMEGCTTFANLSTTTNNPARGFGGTGRIANSILWDGIGELPSDFTAIQINHSNIFGGWPGHGNIFQPPAFVDPDGPDNSLGTLDDDFRILKISPCINAGDPAAMNIPPTLDLDGNPRVVGGRIDMGAFEFLESCQVDQDCSDNNACTLDACDATFGCLYSSACGAGFTCQNNTCLPDCGNMDTDDDGDIDLIDLAVWQNCFDGPMP